MASMQSKNPDVIQKHSEKVIKRMSGAAKAANRMQKMQKEDSELEEEVDIKDPSDGSEQNSENKKNNVTRQDIGGKSKVSNIVTKRASAPEASHIAGIKEDIDALTEGESLSEEFKEKAAIIFEAAVVNRVKQEVARLEESYQEYIEEEIESVYEGLVDKIDGYLDYVVEQWMEDNEIALERGMKSEILEGFVGGLKSLFEEHYIDIPEEKFDVLSDLQERVDDLSSLLDEQVSTNISLKRKLQQTQAEQVVHYVSEGLAETDKEKLAALVEDLAFEDVESFAVKVQTIRESYFPPKTKTKKVVESFVTDEPVFIKEDAVLPANMQQYVSMLNSIK
jgi:hypothetical protein